MSAKLLYSLSDENQNLKKQIGCMNGFLQFFDPHHFINNRVISSPIHSRISPDDNKLQKRRDNNPSSRPKEKHLKDITEMQMNHTESSRLSNSSSRSTAISSSPEQSQFAESIYQERHSWDHPEKQPHFSPCAHSSPAKMNHYLYKKLNRETVPNSASPIIAAPIEVEPYAFKHMDSPRLSHTSRPGSPRFASLDESFRSISSNYSAPAVTQRNKDPARCSYDGRETRDSYISTLKLKDLPRFSLDSKQRTIKESVHESKDDLLLRSLKRGMRSSNKIHTAPQKPTSCRTPSNIVAKLMGLELPDHKPSNKSQIENDGSNFFPSSESFSRSTRTIDNSKVDRVLHSARGSCKEPRAPQLNNTKPGKTASIHQEAHSEPIKHPLTVYGAIERRLADIDFQKSGKDLRALKQILESMHREKNKLDMKKEILSLHCTSPASNSSCTHISQKQGPKKAILHTSKGFGSVKDVRSPRQMKPTKLVTDSRKEETQVVQDIPLTRVQQLRIVQPVEDTMDSVQKKTAKDLKETHQKINKYSKERAPRSSRTSKAPETTTKTIVTRSARISDTKRTNVHCINPARTTSCRVKQKQQALSQHEKLLQNFTLLQETDDQPCEFSNGSASLSQQQPTKSFLSQQPISESKSPEGTQGDTAFEELAITVRELTSPVSVLDASFYDDESPSPVKKKPTAFRDFESNTIYNEEEWKYADPTYNPDSVRLGFGYASDNKKVEDFKQSASAVWKLSSYQQGNLRSVGPNQNDSNLEKSYVSEILLASGLLHNLNYVDDYLVYQSQEVINPKLFNVLEQTRGSSFNPDKRSYSGKGIITRTNERHRRKLLFDTVNEILSRKLSQSKPFLIRQLRHATNGSQLLQEIFKEIDQLNSFNLPNGVDNEDDFLKTIIENNLKQRSANWTDFSDEIPALVLHIERLIFKDLIEELVQDKAT